MVFDFQGKRVLIVEDCGIAAAEIAHALEAANATILGPFARLEDAEAQVMYSELAILDVKVRGRTSFALADRLGRLKVPYIFFSGYDRDRLPERFAGIDCVSKLTSPWVALHHLSVLVRVEDKPVVIDLIPALREQARRYLPDPHAADRLVERTLRMAIDEAPGDRAGDLELWLRGLMARAYQSGSAQLLN